MHGPDAPSPSSRRSGAARAPGIVSLGAAVRGTRGVVVRVGVEPDARDGGRDPGELERRLLEMGFVEGAAVEILHEGLIGRDPIAVRIDDRRVALRRREADAILVRLAGIGD